MHTPKPVILVDRHAAAEVCAALEHAGLLVLETRDGEGLDIITRELHPDAVLVTDHAHIADMRRHLDAIDCPAPVIAIIHQANELRLARALDAGADAAHPSTTSPDLLASQTAALLRALERRAASEPQNTTVGDLKLREDGRVHVAGERVNLTPTEYRILACLAHQPGAVRSREELALACGAPVNAESRAVDSHVKAIRRKIGDGRIRTAHGFGYALETAA